MKINKKPAVRQRLKKHFFWKRESIRCKNPAYFYSKYFKIAGYRTKRLTNNQYGKLLNTVRIFRFNRATRINYSYQRAMFKLQQTMFSEEKLEIKPMQLSLSKEIIKITEEMAIAKAKIYDSSSWGIPLKYFDNDK